ncbi:Nn.00g107910.m01.CDS01 [Neocucurbitaria sp. VM-36]
MAENARKHLLGKFKELLKNGAFSDLTITCGSDTYKLHKAIVCSRGEFFASAINFGGKEAEEDEIDLPNDEPAIVKLLVQYFCEGEYDLVDDKIAPSQTSSTASDATVASPSRNSKKRRLAAPEVTKKSCHSCDDLWNSFCIAKICPHPTCGIECSEDLPCAVSSWALTK